MERTLEFLKKWKEPVFQALISIVLLALMFSCGMIPLKYMGIAVLIALLLLALTFLAVRSRNTAVRSVGIILAVLTCLVCVIGALLIQHVMNKLNQMAGAETQIENIVVMVNDTDRALAIADTPGYSFGVFEGADSELIDQMIDDVQQLNGDGEIQKQVFDSPLTLAEALLDGDVDAAICNKAYLSLLEDSVPDYSKQAKIIYEKEYETDPDRWERMSALDEDQTGTGESMDETSKNASLTDHSFNVLISGIDVDGPITATSRSDVNIIMTVNPMKQRILLTSTPRDYYVHIPYVSGEELDKLTHAGIYGVKTSMKTLENLYGVGISDYIRINFDSLIQLVDVLGGVDVKSEVEFSSGSYHFVKGINHLNGDQALVFSRVRHAFADGDIQRGKNQMNVLTAILNKLQSRALLKNPADVLDVISQSMQTSFSTSQITKTIAWQLENRHRWEIKRQSVTGSSDSQETFSMPGTELSVIWPDEDSVREAAGKIRDELK